MNARVERIGPGVAPGRWDGIAALGDASRAPYLFVAGLALVLLPALIWPIPNAADIVNHWARLTLLGMSADDPLAKLYAVKFAIIPNLAIDLLYLALAPIMSAQAVARLVWALALALPAWGAWRLHRVLFKTPQLGILLIPAISYNLVVTVGLVNYGIGMGVALLALAWAIETEARPFGAGSSSSTSSRRRCCSATCSRCSHSASPSACGRSRREAGANGGRR